MCGIAGFVIPPNLAANLETKTFFALGRKEVLYRMTKTLVPRGLDEEGFFLDNIAALGIRRLIVIDPKTGHQPMSNEDDLIHVVHNGEIYNFKELLKELDSKGHNIKSKSDTETIVHLYEEKGIECVKDLHGMFAFALWDSKNKKLVLARDRLGQKPLYYAVTGTSLDQGLVFASEPKAIFLHPAITREINWTALDFYLSYGYVPSPFSIYQRINKLPPGHILVWENGKVKLLKYWELPLPSDNALRTDDRTQMSGNQALRPTDKTSNKTLKDTEGKIIELLNKAVSSHLVSDVPVGAFLSGGTDSATVAAIMQAKSLKPIHTFSLGFPFTPNDELNAARHTASYLGTIHHEFTMEKPDINILNNIMDVLDEPFADSSFFPTYVLARETKKEVTVVLSGDGGDELFCGYDWLRLAMFQELYHNLPLFIRKLLNNIISRTHPGLDRTSGFLGMARRFFGEGILPVEEGYFRRISSFTGEMKKLLYKPETIKSMNNYETQGISDPLKDKFYLYKNMDFGSRMLLTDTSFYLPDDGLFKLDRMCMANSLETRVPFLDHHLVEYMASIPFYAKFHPFKRKPVLKSAVAGLVSPETFASAKKGFSPPLNQWLKNSFSQLVLELVFNKDSFVLSFGNKEFITNIWNEFTNNLSDWGHQVWTLLILELWHRKWIRGI